MYPKIYNPFKHDRDTRKVINGSWVLPVFDYLQNNQWSFTEKLDGMNIRLYPETRSIYGRTDRAQIPGQLYTHLQGILEDTEKNDELFLQFGSKVVLYGEGIGPKIQKGGKYCDYQKFVLFDVHTEYGWLNRSQVLDAGHILGIPCVPLVTTGTLHHGIEFISYGLQSHYGKFLAEGVVGQPIHNFNELIRIKIKGRDFPSFQGLNS